MITAEQITLLVGKRVEMVCFAQFSVYIHLDGGILLTVEAEFEHIHDGAHRGHRTTFPITESGLISLLESSVVSAVLVTNGDLRIAFSSGESLCISKEAGFESYRLRIEGEEFIA